MVEGLDNVYITNTLQNLSTDFQGVYSCNNIPSELLLKQRFIIICNLSRHDEKGSHFITIVSHPESTLYIDSFGLPCLNTDIASFLAKRGGKLLYNERTIQDTRSIFCGFYCIFFCLLFDSYNKKPNHNFIFSSTNLVENDQRCILYIKELIVARGKIKKNKN